jgi:Family of unknown function (DUF6510)
MDALDGNAIAGDLFATFGHEMTTAVGTCTSCGAGSAIAELRVYVSGPGIVARCRTSTRPNTRARRGIRSCARSSPAKTGAGA